ncbi:MAG: IS110 family transposase [Chloroflexi bacterium]|nr:IS110 family transposase [Chloroflexota bacterium]
MIHVGIDIAKSKLDICTSNPAQPPRNWPITTVRFDDEQWHLRLAALVPDGATVVMEPTGWHYMKPVITALQPINCTVWQVPTTTTGKIRDVHISTGKSDKMDARALALAATWIAAGHPVKGAYPHSPTREEAAHNLRLLLNQYTRETKQQTRLLNQLDALAHSIWPVLAIKKETWLKAVQHGAITPAELRDLGNRPDLNEIGHYWHGATRNALYRLIDAIPPYVNANPVTAAAIRSLSVQLLTLQNELAATTNEITAALDHPTLNPLADLWMQIPHASPVTIATIIVAVRGQPEAYSREEFKAAVGAHPRTARSSNTTTHSGKKADIAPP